MLSAHEITAERRPVRKVTIQLSDRTRIILHPEGGMELEDADRCVLDAQDFHQDMLRILTIVGAMVQAHALDNDPAFTAQQTDTATEF